MTLGCIAVAGGKGGCGKTTTTVGLGRALVDAGGDPLAVDADVDMPDLAVAAGLAPAPGVGPGERTTGRTERARSAVDADQSSAATDTSSPERGREGLRIVRPPADGGHPRRLDRTLRPLASDEPTVLLDCPAGAGRDAVPPLRVADRVVVVTTHTRRSVADACKTAAMARALGTPVAGVVVTRTADPDDRLASVFEAPRLGAVPAASDPLSAHRCRDAFAAVVDRLDERAPRNPDRAKS